MGKKINPSVLWLSDIHFSCLNKHTESHLIQSYLEQLAEKLVLRDYTHVVITGDLAFSGQAEQYEGLFDVFIKKLLAPKLAGSPTVENRRLIVVCGNHDIDRKILDNGTVEERNALKEKHDRQARVRALCEKIVDKGINKVDDLLLGLSVGYRSFFRKFVAKNLMQLIDDEKILQFNYLESEGLFGVVYDKEYNLVFNCFNSSWYAFGGKPIVQLFTRKDELKKRIKTHRDRREELAKKERKAEGEEKNKIEKLVGQEKNEIDDIAAAIEEIAGEISGVQEFGQLVLGTLALQNAILEREIVRNKIQEECFIISMAHHPFSWLSYETQYHIEDKENSLSKMLEYSDIFLSGHQHVPHYSPSSYRQFCFVLESPQLLDHGLYGLNNEKSYVFGFSQIRFDHAKSEFHIHQQEVELTVDLGENSKKLGRLNFQDKEPKPPYALLNKKGRGGKNKLMSRKTILEGFESFEAIKTYLEGNYNIPVGKSANCSDFIDKAELLKNLISRKPFSNTPQDYVFDEFTNFWVVYTKGSCKVMLKNIQPTTKTVVSDLGKLFCEILEKLEGNFLADLYVPMKEIKLLFLDHWIYKLDDKKSEPKSMVYQDYYENFQRIFTIFKGQFFESEDNLKWVSLLKRVGISFDIVNFERYKFYCIKGDESTQKC